MQSIQQSYSRPSSQSDLSDHSDHPSSTPYGSFQASGLHPQLSATASLALPQAAYAPRPLDPASLAHAPGGYQPQPQYHVSPQGSVGYNSDFSHHDERHSHSPTEFRHASTSQLPCSPDQPGPSRGPGSHRSPGLSLGLPTLGPAGAGAGAGPAPERERDQAADQANPDFAQTFYDPFRIKHRRRTTPGQLKILESHFEVNAKPDVTLRKSLAEQLEMTPREVQVWFQNRRAKTKKLREKAEKEGSTPDDGEAYLCSPEQPTSTSPTTLNSQPLPLGLPPSLASGSSEFAAMRRGSSPAIMSHPGTRHPDLGAPDAAPFAPQPFAGHVPDDQVFLYEPAQLQLHSQAYAPLEAVQPFQAQPHLDPSGRRFSLPAYHPSHYGAGQYDGHGRMGSQQSGYSTDSSLLDPNALMGPTTDDLVSPISSNPSPNFAAFEHGYKEGADLSPSSSADELSASHDYQARRMGYNSQQAYQQQQQQQQQQPVYSMAGYTFGAPTPQPGEIPFGHGQDMSLSPDGFGHDHGRRASLNTAFNGLGLASPSQHQPGWGPAAQNGYLPPQMPHGVPLTAAAQQALLQKRHSVAATGMGMGMTGYSMGANGGANGYGGGASLSGTNGQGLPAYAQAPNGGQQFQQQFLGPNAGAIAAGRRGSTSSLLGTIAEQPSGLAGTRLAYGVTAQDVEDGGEFGPLPMALERRGSLAGPTARKARSQTQLRTSPYGQPQADPNRRSPGLGGNGSGERRGSAVGIEYVGY